MVVILHVLMALTSMAWTTFLLFAPTKQRFYISYALIGLTFVSGTYLVISTHAGLLRSCITGLTYLAIVAAGVLLARYRFARQEARTWRHTSDEDDR